MDKMLQNLGTPKFWDLFIENSLQGVGFDYISFSFSVRVESNGGVLTQKLVMAVYTFSRSQSRSLSIVALFNGSRGYKLCPVA